MACRTSGKAACVLGLALAAMAPAVPAPASPSAGTARAVPVAASQSTAAAAVPQHLRVGDVRIEGKVYSPQALFIVSRPTDRFDHTVVPRYLQLDASANLLPYRLRPEILNTARATPEATSPTQARP